ncbi:hypothetical protein C8R44DRAFT_531496, partial [Mycena epipterygia]
IDLASLCDYCDQILPAVPSDQLIAMGQKLYRVSWSQPLPDNPNHRRTPLITMTVDYCQRHRFEREHLPEAICGGWPFSPNFSRLFHRI